MKTLLICLCISFFAGAAMGQLPVATGHNLLLDVINKGAGGKGGGSLGGGLSGGASSGAVGTTTSTAIQSQTHSTALAVSIRSQDKTPTQVQIEWYFFARKIQANHVSKDAVFDSGNKTVTIQPTGSETFDVVSKAVQTSTSRRYETSTSYNSATGNNSSTTYAVGPDMRNGTKISGWVVRILVDGKVIDAKGSEFKYEDAAKNPDKFEALKSGQ